MEVLDFFPLLLQLYEVVQYVVAVLCFDVLEDSEFIGKDLICHQLVEFLQGVPHLTRSLARSDVHKF